METKQIFIVCNDFVGAKHGLHNLWNAIWYWNICGHAFKNKFEDFLHDVYSAT